MPRSGGNYSLPTSSWYPAVANTTIDPDDSNSTLEDIAQALTDSTPADGTKQWTGNWDAGGHKLTDLAAATTNGDAVRYEQLTALSGAYQPLDGTLTALAGLAWSANTPLVQLTAADTVSLTSTPKVTTIDLGDATDTTLSRAGAGVLAVEGVNVLTTATGQPLDATLTAFAAQTTGADLIWYWTGTDAGATTTLSSFGRTLIDDADASTARTTLGVPLGTSGAVLGLLNANKTDSGANTYTNTQIYSAAATVPIMMRATSNMVEAVFYSDAAGELVWEIYQQGSSSTKYNLYLLKYGGTLKVGGSAAAFATRPTFNGNTALDTGNGAQLGAFNTFTEDQLIASGAPSLRFQETDGGTDAKNWWVTVDGGALAFRLINDAQNAANSVLTLARTGYASAVTTFNSGDVVLANVAPTSNYSVGYRRFCPASVTTGSVVAADSGKCVYATGSVTVPNSVFSATDSYGILAGGSARTITQGSGVTLTNGNTGATGSCTLAANGFATVVHTSASAATVFGNV